jgi:glycosyltransferase involved in cell wall biosynthesis
MRGQRSVAPDFESDSARWGVAEGVVNSQSMGLPAPMVTHPKRVLLLAPAMAPLVDSIMLIEAMQLRGHRVTCCAPRFDEKTIKVFARLNVDTRALDLPALGLSPASLGKASRRLKEVFADISPDLVVAIATETGPTAPIVALLAKAPEMAMIIRGLSRVVAQSGVASRWIDWPKRKALLSLYGYALRGSRRVVFHSRDDERLFRSLGLAPKTATMASVNGPGADFDLHQEQAALPPMDKGIVFLMAADLDDVHGVRDYCQAARMLRAKARNVRCVLIGGLPAEGKNIPLNELRRYRGAVHYIGPREDLRPYVAKCHVFVAPSRGGGATPGLIAALAAGRPLITTDTRGCRDAVAEGANGIIVPPCNPKALFEGMAQILRRPDLLPSMAAASRIRAKHHFDVIAINEIVMETLGL